MVRTHRHGTQLMSQHALQGLSVCSRTCRYTCENVVRVLRENKDSVMAMLEAFVHDPLINWRLLNTTDAGVADSNFIQDGSGKDLLGVSSWGQGEASGFAWALSRGKVRPST